MRRSAEREDLRGEAGGEAGGAIDRLEALGVLRRLGRRWWSLKQAEAIGMNSGRGATGESTYKEGRQSRTGRNGHHVKMRRK